MKIDINLSTMRYRRSNAPYVLIAALVAIAASWSAYNFFNYGINQKRIALYKEISARNERKSPPAAPPADVRQIKEKVSLINGIIIQETFSWTGLLTALEQSVPDNVSIIELAPQFTEGKIVVKGMAKSMKDVLEFVSRLGGSKHFTGVFLLKHSEEGIPSSLVGERLTFSVSAVYAREGTF
ncbi:MAG: PilN domain-containing protein [Deltaproteobacteria bacterium]|nr:PilN domain-containing protein [Deltaproteobacteria bacterium]